MDTAVQCPFLHKFISEFWYSQDCIVFHQKLYQERKMINVLFGIFDEVFIITMLSFNNLSFNFLNEF